MTPVLMIAASNLTSNVGLQPNAAMTSYAATVSSNTLVSRYANLQPGTTYGTTLSGRGFSVVNLQLPEFVANANTTIANVQTQYNKMLPANGDGTYNIAKFASVLSSVSSFAYTSWTMNNLLESMYTMSFGDLGIGVTDFASSLNNGLTADEIRLLGKGLRNFGTALDIKNYSRLYDPKVFVNNLIAQGLLSKDWYSIYNKSVVTEQQSSRLAVVGIIGLLPNARQPENTPYQVESTGDLMKALALVTGSDLDNIIAKTGIQLPYPALVTNLAHLLELSRIFPSDSLLVVPAGTMAGLSVLLANIGGTYGSFGEMADMIDSLSVPAIPYLNAYTQVIPDVEYNRLSTKLGMGAGAYTNPLVTDMMGSVAGVVHANALATVSSALTSTLTYTEAQTLSSRLADLYTACGTGNATFIDSNIALTWTAANAFTTLCNTNSTLSSVVTQANIAVKAMTAQVILEQNNLTLADANLDATAPTGVNSVLGMVSSLHDYGVDTYQLNYNTLFNSCLQSNVGGDAVRAALIEGQNIANQRAKGVPVLTLQRAQVG